MDRQTRSTATCVAATLLLVAFQVLPGIAESGNLDDPHIIPATGEEVHWVFVDWNFADMVDLFKDEQNFIEVLKGKLQEALGISSSRVAMRLSQLSNNQIGKSKYVYHLKIKHSDIFLPLGEGLLVKLWINPLEGEISRDDAISELERQVRSFQSPLRLDAEIGHLVWRSIIATKGIAIQEDEAPMPRSFVEEDACGWSVGTTVGVVVGCLSGLAVVLLVTGWWFYKRRLLKRGVLTPSESKSDLLHSAINQNVKAKLPFLDLEAYKQVPYTSENQTSAWSARDVIERSMQFKSIVDIPTDWTLIEDTKQQQITGGEEKGLVKTETKPNLGKVDEQKASSLK